MKKLLLFAIIVLLDLKTAQAQTDSCLNLINGALKGQPGNIQDNMFHNLHIDTNNSDIVYAGTETSGMFKTTDGGQTWQRLRRGLKCTVQQTGYPQIFNITADPANVNVVYASTVTGPGPVTGYLFSSASGGVYKSSDGGLTWHQRNIGLTNSYNTFILINPYNSQELFAAIAGLKSTQPSLGGQFFTGVMYKSINAGSSWTKLNTPLLTDSNSVWNAVYSKTPQPVIYCSWHAHDAGVSSLGLVKSTDNGNSWSVINPIGKVIGNFDVFNKNGNYIIGTDNSSDHFAYTSNDGGDTWQPLNKKFYGEFKIHPTDSSIVFFLGGGKNITRTTNGFQSTQVIYTDNSLTDIQPRQYIEDIKISESNPNIIWACAQGYYLYKSVDGGNSFRKITAIRDSIYSASATLDNLNYSGSKITIYPNPTNNIATFELLLTEKGKVFLSIFNALGQNISAVVDDCILNIGVYKYNFDFSEFPNAVYYAVLRINNTVYSQKLVIQK